MTVMLCVSACKDFDELQIDPNRPVQAQPGLLLTGIETSVFEVVDVGAMLASRMMVFTDGTADEQYYSWQRNSFDRYDQLRQISKMVEEAERTGLDNYKSLALFLRSVVILEISKVFGDVPYSEAVQAATGIDKPAYDLQQEIYAQVLTDLEQANATLDADAAPDNR